jgi:predicted metal-binding protein
MIPFFLPPFLYVKSLTNTTQTMLLQKNKNGTYHSYYILQFFNGFPGACILCECKNKQLCMHTQAFIIIGHAKVCICVTK